MIILYWAWMSFLIPCVGNPRRLTHGKFILVRFLGITGLSARRLTTSLSPLWVRFPSSLWTGLIHFPNRAYFLCISELVMIINFFVPTINHSWLQLGRSSVLLISSSVHIILHLEASTNHPSMGKAFSFKAFVDGFIIYI